VDAADYVAVGIAVGSATLTVILWLFERAHRREELDLMRQQVEDQAESVDREGRANLVAIPGFTQWRERYATHAFRFLNAGRASARSIE